MRIRFLTMEEFSQEYASFSYSGEMTQSLAAITYCKAEIYKDVIEGVVRIPATPQHMAEETAFGFYLYLDELCFVEARPKIQKVWEARKEKMDAADSADQHLMFFLDELTREDIFYLQSMEKEMSAHEEEEMKCEDENFLRRFMRYRRSLSELHFYYEQMITVGDVLCAEYGRRGQGELSTAWQQFAQRMNRLYDYVTYLREYAMQIREIANSQKEAKQNRVINLLTVVTSLFLPLTLLTGWYGMNFAYMPEVEWRYGYVLVIIVAVGIVAAEVGYIRKKKFCKMD